MTQQGLGPHPGESESPSLSLLLLLGAMGASMSLYSDMVIPSLPSIRSDLLITDTDAQQLISFFFLACAFMALWHGAIADFFGRRASIMGSLVVLALSSLACIAIQHIEHLWFLRIIQGLAAGAGIILSRAIVRDLYSGLQAQKIIGQMSLLQTLIPIAAPLMGGWLAASYGWRAVFASNGLLAVMLIALFARALPETLPAHMRQTPNLAGMVGAYRAVFGSGRFLRLAVSHAMSWSGMFIYVAAAPKLLLVHFTRPTTDTYQIFAAIMVPMMFGFLSLPRLLKRLGSPGTLKLSYAVYVAAILLNISLSIQEASWLQALLPLALYSFALAMSTAILIAGALEPFAQNSGTASSCQMFIQFVAMGLVAGVLAPLLWNSLLNLALGNGALLALSWILLIWQQRITNAPERPPTHLLQ